MTRSTRVLAVTLVALFAAWTGVTATAAAAATSTAVVVIDTGQGVRSTVIHFDGTISGISALQLAGGDPQVAGYAGVGGAVCTIDGYGNDQTQGVNCLVGPGSQYWAYFRSHNGAGGWSYSNVGGGGTTVSDGDVEGWRYGVGQQPRSAASFCAYVACAPPPTDPPPPPAPVTAAPPAAASVGGTATNAAPGAVTDPGGTATTTAPTTTPGGKAKNGDSTGAEGQDGTAADSSSPSGKASDGTSADGTPASTRRANGDDRQVALGASGSDGDGGSGSPVGVVIVAAILLAVAGAVAVQRKRTRDRSGVSP